MDWFIVTLLILLDTYVAYNKLVDDEIKVGYFIVSSILGLCILLL